MKQVVVALVLITASMVAAVSAVSTGSPTATLDSRSQRATVLQILDGIQHFIEQLDQLLEAIVDLLNTLQELFGGEGGD